MTQTDADNRTPGEARTILVREVGPRDGFQNEPETIATPDKIRLINALGAAGFKRIEVASFVRPDVIPQLSDGLEVLRGIDLPDDVLRQVLVPNAKGLDNALKVRELIDEVAFFVSASETHNKLNINRAVDETMADVKTMAPRALAEGLTVCAVVATSFGCPYEGKVEIDRVLDLAEQFAAAGATEIGFGDTTGMANPAYAARLFAAAVERLPGVELTAHFHNTRGQGLANAYAAFQVGCHSFESSVGELGGCPVPAGSTGNIASEDLISMFHEMGVDTGVDLDRLIDVARDAQSTLGRKLTSHSLVAGPVIWQPTSDPVAAH